MICTEAAARSVSALIEKDEAQAERVARQSQHAPELAGADDADLHVELEILSCGSASGSSTAVGLLRAEALEAVSNLFVLVREDGCSEQSGVRCARGADRERRDGNPRRHLDDGKQRVEAVQRLRLHRHAEHRQGSFSRPSFLAGALRRRRPR